jgi:hypothetical protein
LRPLREIPVAWGTVDTETAWRFFEREDITFKKSVQAIEQERPDVAEARTQWKIHQPRLDPAKLVFVDETGASTNSPTTSGNPDMFQSDWILL